MRLVQAIYPGTHSERGERNVFPQPMGREEKEEGGAGTGHWHKLLSQFSPPCVTAGLGAHLDQWTL